MNASWDLWLSVAWRIVAIALIVVEAIRPATEVSQPRLILYAAMLGVPSVVQAVRRNGDSGDESR